ncbi:tripartite motif-containing protein 16 [Fundulus heteroclitus]|uniref:tripartite motif-containing protein 16 n=1 Tax=Fundulus heteroclitus TaxID=8078 RepID=UPI00165A4492|nr:tripartite motif-containing protein 16 [Fundulus heteroclitus]
MAHKRAQLEEEDVHCEVCFDLLKFPVTIPCGHSFCINCIKGHWDEEPEGSHSCPQCRRTFEAGSSEKSSALAGLVEQLKKIRIKDAAQCHAGAGDVLCGFCAGGKVQAVSFCFVCLFFYCDKHAHSHRENPPSKRHKLVKPSASLRQDVCSRHGEVFSMFCRTDQKCVCGLCLLDAHKGHDTVPAAAERAERQRRLEASRGGLQQGILDREKDVKLLEVELDSLNRSVDQTVEDSQQIFTALVLSVKQQLRCQQEREVSRVRELQEKLEQEISELKWKDAELKRISDTEDHSQFFQNLPSLSALSQSTPSSSVAVRPLRHFGDVTAALSELREKLQDILRDTWADISLRITDVEVSLSEPEPQTRDDLLKYWCNITLDPNTANTSLFLSEGDRKVTRVIFGLPYSAHQDRFTECHQILSRESLTRRSYWEVEWTDHDVSVAVAYKTISRAGRGKQCRYGQNDRSWALVCSQHGYEFCYNNTETSISGPHSSRIGVYLDHRAGVLSFYSVSETTTLLHRVQTSFTKPLHAGGLTLVLVPGSGAWFWCLVLVPDRNNSSRRISTRFTNQETADQETANQETANQDRANQETANQDTANQDTANQDTANRKKANQDTANRKKANQDTANQDTANQELCLLRRLSLLV